MRINSAQGTKKRIYVTPHKSQWHVGQVNSFHSEVRKLLMQTENITVFFNLSSMPRTASHEKEEVHPRSANRETKRELSNAQRNLGRETQRGDWVLTEWSS